jgi:glyoxylase-like metal-dependent hydrolase (beta-lactamase superfamily II)
LSKRDRREFLGLGLAVAIAGVAGPWRAAQAKAAARLALAPLSGRLSLVTGGAANILVASSGKELVLVDGGAAADAKALQKLLAANYPGQPVRAVFNTHWHWAQTGFNAAARAQGIDVLAHENTKLWLTTVVNSRWEGKVYPPQPAVALPNKTFFYGVQQLAFGASKIEYGHLGQAHTDGDIYVRFPEENVIVAGDVLAPARYPIVDPASNGWLGGIQGALRTIGGLGDGNTRLVPGTGPVVGLDVLKQQQEMCYSVISRIGENYYKGGTFEEFVASNPTRDFDAQYGDPALFLKQAYDTAWYHVGDIRRVAR